MKELIEQLIESSSVLKEASIIKLRELEKRTEKAQKFEQDIHTIIEGFNHQQDELENSGSVRGVPDGIKEQLEHHMVKLIITLYCVM